MMNFFFFSVVTKASDSTGEPAREIPYSGAAHRLLTKWQKEGATGTPSFHSRRQTA